MRYVQVIESFAYGAAKSVKQLSEELKDSAKVTVYYGVRDGTELEVKDLNPDIEWVKLPGTGLLKHLQNIIFLRGQFSDLDHIWHGHSSYAGLYVKFARLLNNKAANHLKCLYSPRGYAFLREDFPWLFRQFFWCFEKLTCQMAITVACGPSEYQMAKKMGGQVEQINNSLSVPDTNVDYCHEGPILSVGRICYQKGFDIYLDIVRSMPHHNFIWVGSCEPKHNKLVSSIPNNLKLIPYIPHDQLLCIIKECSVMLLPSRWEGLSRVLLETLVVGRPIVTSSFPANVDCLKPSFDGFKNGYSCNNVLEYIDALEDILSDSKKAKSMAIASRDYAISDFEFEKVKASWRELYCLNN